MTVYVYRLKGQWPVPPIRMYVAFVPPWFGMTADTEEELHPLAEQIGLYRHFYRPRDLDQPFPVGHYDLDEGERDRAVAGGAVRITARKLDRLRRQRAAQSG